MYVVNYLVRYLFNTKTHDTQVTLIIYQAFFVTVQSEHTKSVQECHFCVCISLPDIGPH